MYKIIASDLDGTLLNSDHRLSEESINILQQLVAKGLIFVFATGRHHCDVKAIKNSANIPAYMVTSNGARIHDPKGDLIYAQNVDPKIAEDLVKLVQPFSSVSTHIFRDDDWFCEEGFNLDESIFCPDSEFNYQAVNLAKLNKENIAKIYFTAEFDDELLELEKIIAEKWKNKVNVCFSSSTCLEVMDFVVSKANALEIVAKQNNISLQDCIAFGDGMNDVEMLSEVGKGYVMQNASPRVKAVLSNLEIIGTNKEHSVVKYLAKIYGLILNG